MTRKNFQSPTDEEIARYAYCLWESEGRIHGRDLDFWLQAEAHLKAAREYEAGLLEQVNAPKLIEKPQAIPTITRAPVPKQARRRAHRMVQEAEPVCA